LPNTARACTPRRRRSWGRSRRQSNALVIDIVRSDFKFRMCRRERCTAASCTGAHNPGKSARIYVCVVAVLIQSRLEIIDRSS
jgi:hypothetical protein